jgi:hypothetical protein
MMKKIRAGIPSQTEFRKNHEANTLGRQTLNFLAQDGSIGSHIPQF